MAVGQNEILDPQPHSHYIKFMYSVLSWRWWFGGSGLGWTPEAVGSRERGRRPMAFMDIETLQLRVCVCALRAVGMSSCSFL